MASDESALFSREGLLGGLSARRATTLLFAIENRTAHLVAQIAAGGPDRPQRARGSAARAGVPRGAGPGPRRSPSSPRSRISSATPRSGPTWCRTTPACGRGSRISWARSTPSRPRRCRGCDPPWASTRTRSGTRTRTCTERRWRRSMRRGRDSADRLRWAASRLAGPARCAACLLARVRRHADHRRRQPRPAHRGRRGRRAARHRADRRARDHQRGHGRGDGRSRHAQRQHPLRQRLHRHGGRRLPGKRQLGHPLGGPDRLLVRPPADLLHRHLDDPGRCDGAARALPG